MRNRKIYSLCLLGLVVLGCMSSSVNKIEIKNYFYPLDKFNRTLVYEWEYKTDGSSFATYYIYKKLSNNELQISIINQDFNVVTKFSYMYKTNGIYIKDINNYDIEQSGKIINEKVIDSLVFTYHFINGQSLYSTVFTPDEHMTINRIVTRKFNSFDTNYFNGNKISVIKASGETKLVMESKDYPNEKHTSITYDELIYGENYGAISHDSKNESKLIQRRLKRIISIEEFEKRKALMNKE